MSDGDTGGDVSSGGKADRVGGGLDLIVTGTDCCKKRVAAGGKV